MKLNGLIRLAKLNHLNDFSIEDLISNFSLYQMAIIDLSGVRFTDGSREPFEFRAVVSQDVEKLNALLIREKPVLLNCPVCQREIPFCPGEWHNPQNMDAGSTQNERSINTIGGPKAVKTATRTMNVFDQTAPFFRIGQPVMAGFLKRDDPTFSDPAKKIEYIKRCVDACKTTLLAEAAEIRRDYFCTLDKSHYVFVDFRIFDPLLPYPEQDLIENSSQNVELAKAIEKLKNCLIIQKVGQYPSIADMQLFDIGKYRTVLKENYSDFTRAIGLFANGIGCGSFVYLRRILEKLAEEEHQACINIDGWNDDHYSKSKFIEKLDLLEEYGHSIIPQEIQSFKGKIYGILSKGIHESSEEDCLELFSYMVFAIEEILDKKMRQLERENKLKKFQKKIGNL